MLRDRQLLAAQDLPNCQNLSKNQASIATGTRKLLPSLSFPTPELLNWQQLQPMQCQTPGGNLNSPISRSVIIDVVSLYYFCNTPFQGSRHERLPVLDMNFGGKA